MKKIILTAGGIVNIILGLFHIFFWQLFNWSEELPRLSLENQGILQIANIILIFIILFFGVISLVMARRGNIEIYGKSILAVIIIFYAIRMFTGYIFFPAGFDEFLISAVCLCIIAGYSYVLFKE